MNSAVERIQKYANKAEWNLMSFRTSKDAGNCSRIYHHATGWAPGKFDTIFQYQGRAFIEPKFGYVVSESGHLFEESLTPNIPMPTPPWRHGLPDPRSFKSKVKSKDNILHFSKVISLRHHWEWNYFHFYCDVLGKLKLVDTVLDQSIPLVLGNYVDDVSFARQILSIGSLADRSWIMPGNRWVSADEIYFCNCRQSWKNRLSYIVSQMDLPMPDDTSPDRTYLIRPQSATRRVLNQEEIDPVLKKHGFTTVDTVRMTILEQIQLFAKTRHLIAIHGAGIVNVMYRDGAPLSLIELRSDVYATEDMQEICVEYGYPTTFLRGKSDGGTPQHASFTVDPGQLEEKIIQMCGSE